MLNQKYNFFLCIFIITVATSCMQKILDSKAKSDLKSANFKALVNGDSTHLYVLRNTKGMEVSITNYGGRIVSLLAPDKNGKLLDVVLGFDNIQDYLAKPNSFGAIMGRVTNRIANGTFLLNGDTIKIDKNNGQHAIHGGSKGWRQQVFRGSQLSDSMLVLSYLSPDGESGFPGNVKVKVRYTLTNENALIINYEAETDKSTVINLTNHSFFNLSGNPQKTVLDDILFVRAKHFTPVDSNAIPTGEIRSVSNTPFDFTVPTSIRSAINRDSTHKQLVFVSGLDHNWVLDTDGNLEIPAASVYSPTSGIKLTVFSNEPGLQVYTGNTLDKTQKGKDNIPFQKYGAICLETQHFPDTPNQPTWPSVTLNPGEQYKSTCIYQFSIE
ncbi:galactose mutarotase [Olivibacter sp. LS-1]|nr:galactose mutarotase [Olivibacter sp. LS-1]